MTAVPSRSLTALEKQVFGVDAFVDDLGNVVERGLGNMFDRMKKHAEEQAKVVQVLVVPPVASSPSPAPAAPVIPLAASGGNSAAAAPVVSAAAIPAAALPAAPVNAAGQPLNPPAAPGKLILLQKLRAELEALEADVEEIL